ncbi:hypothetical protein [Ferrimonas balearica]|uniref:hypothetical protein n=1 Tax=Ferrimonas balearica TaxID=44012 RepID=UPI001C58357A|nr:hypothetical protein [Ferrimonas balearica]MBW3140579.1 hypothetical protein [Ferrimonas balearica]MBY6226260.1 hypothetical protein [Ferrimonas balearica]
MRWLGAALALGVWLWALPVLAAPAHQLCRLDALDECVEGLSPQWRGILQRLWPGPLAVSVKTALAGQGGVTLLTDTDALILLDPQSLKRPHLVLLDKQLIERPPLRTFRTTYYHELGHVATRNSPWLQRLARPNWPQHWPEEVLADLYLFWTQLREGASMDALWQQVHLRNLGLIQARPDWTHWTTPLLVPLLCQPEALKAYSQRPLEQFLDATLGPQSAPPLAQYRLLGERQFALTTPGIAQPYLASAHRGHWAAMLQPTLDWLGVDSATYLQHHHLPYHDDICQVLR